MSEPPSEAPPVRLSVVIAAYNEARVIGESVDRVAAYLEGRDGELIVVDDGSADQTREIVRARQEGYPHLRLIESGANHGKGHAIKQGILRSRGEYVFYTDADLVYPIQGLEPFVEVLERGAEVAIGSRSHPHTLFALHPRHFSYIYQRYLVGRAYITVVNWWLGLGVRDTQCGFKGFRGEAARTIFARTRLHDFAFDVEALYIARLLGYRVEELPVYFLYLGEQSSVQLVKDSLRMLRDLAIIRRNGRRGLYAADPGLPILDLGLGPGDPSTENPKSTIQNPKSP
ncbi:MAG: glycosyltransferase family 2 protein [Chloroflexi bacterium]|nr:glycosyltransferase family 2 protein [Chloroflexota bacterium]